MLTRKNLFNYQKRAIELIKEKQKFAFFAKMSMGKTVCALTAIVDLKKQNKVNKILLIAPKTICKGEWQRQAKDWEHLSHIKFSLAIGNEKERLNALKNEADIYIINLENVLWLISNVDFNFDGIIIDESHTFKDNSTKRFKSLKKVAHLTKVIILLTGTPSSNSLLDLWSQIYLLDGGTRLGRNFSIFKNRYFISSGFNGYAQILKKGADTAILDAIKDISVSMDTKDYLELPDLMYINKIVELDTKTKEVYKKFEKDFLIEINKTKINALNAATLGIKLLQIANGAIYDENKNTHILHDEKLISLQNILDSDPDENFLIAYNYNSDKERILSRYKDAVLFDGSDEQIKLWNNKKIKLLLCHPKSAGYGLNLQKGGSTIVWFGLSWSLQDYQQFNARIHRIGQQEKVKIIHLISANTIDEKIIKAIQNKAKTQREVMEYLK